MPTKIKNNPETPLVFQNASATTPTTPSGIPITFNAENLPAGSGHISNQYDLGAGPRTTLYEWRGKATIAGTGIVAGSSIEAYLSTSNSIIQDGALSTNDGPMNISDKRRNLQFCGSMVYDVPSGTPDPLQSSGLVEIFGRYISLVWWNNTAAPLASGIGSQQFVLTPVPYEIEN